MTKRQQQVPTSEKAKEPKWWIIYILAPIVVGVVLFILPKACEEKYGELQLACNVDSAEVFLNQVRQGFTLASTVMRVESLQPGVYILSVKKAGFAFVDTSVKIVAGEITSIKAVLTLAAARGDTHAPVPKSATVDSAKTKAVGTNKIYQITITVPNKLKNAKIMIGDKWEANAPAMIKLPKGRHRLRIENEAYYYEEMLQVPSRALVNVTDDEIKKIE